jgi:hypothetical protein
LPRSEIFLVQLDLDREPQHPFGERGRRYDLYVPLHADGSLDEDALRRHRGCCHGTRLRPGQRPAGGKIVLGDAGELVLEYDGGPLRRSVVALDAPLAVGTSVPVTEADGEAHSFQVIAVRQMCREVRSLAGSLRALAWRTQARWTGATCRLALPHDLVARR